MTDHPKVPHNIEAEQALLGTILMDNQSLHAVQAFLEPEHFWEPIHQTLFEIARDKINQGKGADAIIMKTYLPDDADLGGMNAGQYMIALTSASMGGRFAEGYGRAIHETAILRQLYATAGDIMRDASQADAGISVSELVEEAASSIMQISAQAKGNNSPSKASYIADMALQETSEAYQNKVTKGVPCCLPEMEKINQGVLEAGNLYGLLGGTKEGKSSLTAMQITKALDYGHPVLVLSYDQTGIQWFRQMAAQQLGIDGNKQRKGEISEQQFEKLDMFMRSLANQPIEIIKCNRENAIRLCSYAKRFVKSHQNSQKCPIIFMDHVGKVDPLDPRADAGKQAGQSNQLFKAFAGEHDCVWFSLVQRNSNGAQRFNPRPIKKDIYGSEGAVADYDALFYVYRESKWRQDQLKTAETEKKKGELEEIIAQRKGLAEIGLIAHRFAPEHFRQDLKFIPHLTKYESIETDDMQFGEFV